MSVELGAHYLQQRKSRGWSRKEVFDKTGITGGKQYRIENKGEFKDDERQRLDALYASTNDDGTSRDSTPQHVEHDAIDVTSSHQDGMSPEESASLYMRMYALIPEEQRGQAHADATRGFPFAPTFDASWGTATDQQRESALLQIEGVANRVAGITPTDPSPAREDESSSTSDFATEVNLEQTGAGSSEPLFGEETQQPEHKPTHRDITGVGFLIQSDGRAWRHDGDKWQRETGSDVVLLGTPELAPGNRLAFQTWGNLREGSRIRVEGEKGTFTFKAYVIPPNAGPAYVYLIGAGKQRTVAPERVLHNDNSPVMEATYATTVTEDGRIHAAPYSHWSVPEEHRSDVGRELVKLRCGAYGAPDWGERWTSRQLEPALCPRCVELTGGR